nr:BRO family protein [Planktothrix agardhii]
MTTYTPGGEQEMLCVNESGLYSLILGSRKKQAKVFKRWVTGEVLPSIRQTGSYNLKPVELPSPQLISDALVAVFKPTNVDQKARRKPLALDMGISRRRL